MSCKRFPVPQVGTSRLSGNSLSMHVSLIVPRWGAGERLRKNYPPVSERSETPRYSVYASGNFFEFASIRAKIPIIRQAPGDMMVVWKLGRLPCSLKDLLIRMERIDRAGADLRFLAEALDATTFAGTMKMWEVGFFAVIWCPMNKPGMKPHQARHPRIALTSPRVLRIKRENNMQGWRLFRLR